MNLQEWQHSLSDPENWPDEDAENWPADWKLIYWATKEVHTDFASLIGEIEERGLSELLHDVLVQLGYKVAETPARKKEVSLSHKADMHSVRFIARFLLKSENMGKPPHLISSELRDLGYHA